MPYDKDLIWKRHVDTVNAVFTLAHHAVRQLYAFL